MSRIIINKQRVKINLVLKRLLVVLIILIFFTFSFWLISVNFKLNILSNYIESLSKRYDYIFKEVEISSLTNLDNSEINQYFEKYLNRSIFLIPLKEISHEIEKNNWIKSATLKNDFKNKISVYIKELDPIAVFYNGQNYLLISKLGYVIDFVNDNEIQKYIILEGKNANKQATKFIEAIPKELKSEIIKAQYINNRRWDIYTKDNLKIKLPEIGYKKAMNTFVDIYVDLYSPDIINIEFIDLRIPKKAIIKLYNENN